MSIKEQIILWGATGQAKVLRELIQDDFRLVAVFDNNLEIEPPFSDVPLYRQFSGFKKWMEQNKEPANFLVAIGGGRGKVRLEIQEELKQAGLACPAVIHRTAFVAHNAIMGEGSQILAKAAVCVEVRMGKSCIVNTSANVDHECILGDGVHIGPGAHLAGLVEVGDFSFIGTGACVLPRIKIGKNCVIGAGAVITKHIPDGAVVYGNPARPKI